MSSEQQTASACGGNSHGLSVPRFTDIQDTLLSMQDIVGRKWHPIIIYHLMENGPQGFSSLKQDVNNISSKMLSESLDELEAAGLVDRSLISEKPVRVEYELTDEGCTLQPLIGEMIQWGAEHDFEPADALSGQQLRSEQQTNHSRESQ